MSNEVQANNESNNAQANRPRSNNDGANKTANKPRSNKALASRAGFGVIVKTVAFLYLAWAGVVVCDLALCRVNEYNGVGRNKPQLNNAGLNSGDICGDRVREVGGVFTTVTVGLMGWLSDSPSNKGM